MIKFAKVSPEPLSPGAVLPAKPLGGAKERRK